MQNNFTRYHSSEGMWRAKVALSFHIDSPPTPTLPHCPHHLNPLHWLNKPFNPFQRHSPVHLSFHWKHWPQQLITWSPDGTLFLSFAALNTKKKQIPVSWGMYVVIGYIARKNSCNFRVLGCKIYCLKTVKILTNFMLEHLLFWQPRSCHCPYPFFVYSKIKE